MAMFSPEEKLEELKKEFESMKATKKNYRQLKAKVQGFLSGLEKRNRSKVYPLDKAKKQNVERGKEEDRER